MMRLIDADAYLESIKPRGISDELWKECKEYKSVMSFASAQPESCEGCKHIGLWENEVEYGYSSPCTMCKRRVNDNYER